VDLFLFTILRHILKNMTASNEPRPALYSRIFIAIYTILMTPIGGAILFCVNLRNTGRLKSIPFVMLGAMIFEYFHLQMILHNRTGRTDVIFFPSLIFAFLLSFPVWRILLRGIPPYKLLPAWIPLLVAAAAWLAAIGYFQL
jgi:hypothetical protein